MVEFAFSLPFLVLVMAAIMYFGKAYYMIQALSYASQEGARMAVRFPNLKDPEVRDSLRGFTISGTGVNPNSVIYAALGNARLLSDGQSGNLPPGARVRILPWDRGLSVTEANAISSPSVGSGPISISESTPPGTISILIEYPFSLALNPFNPSANKGVRGISVALSADKNEPAVPFLDFTIRQKSTVSQEVYEEDY